MYQYISIMKLVFWKNIFYFSLIKVSECFCTIKSYTSKFGRGYLNLRRVSIQPNSYLLEFSTNLNSLLFSFGGVKDHQNHIWIFSNCNDLSAPTFSFGSPFNNTRQIQKLYFSIVVVNDTWYTGQCSKLICSWQRRSISDWWEKGRLSDWRESNHTDSGITEFTDLKSLTFCVFGFRLK